MIPGAAIFLATVALAGIVAPEVQAADNGWLKEVELTPSVMYFTWEEFVGSKRLLKEDGPLFGIDAALAAAPLEGPAGALLLRAKGGLFGGDVNYDGQTQWDESDPTMSERPVTTDVVYFGARAEGSVGWRLPLQGPVVEPFAGIGYRWWIRSLQDTTAVSSTGVPFAVQGYNENWSSLYALFGVRGEHRLAADAALVLMGAAKYPFYNRNLVDYPGSGDVKLAPGSEWSVQAEAGVRFGRLYAAISYENFNYPRSPQVTAFNTYSNSVIHLYQPESKSELLGLRVSWAFR